MDIDEAMAHVAARLLEEGEALGEELDRTIFEASPELATDATIAAETIASTRANLGRWLGAMAAHPGEPVPGDLPPEALDLARSLVRRGIELASLTHAYRRGQNLAWRRWMDLAAEEIDDRDDLMRMLERSSELMFGYVDRVLEGVIEQVQREREELLGGALARRAETVRLVLDGAPLDPARASARLGYELGRRHTAFVVWEEAPAVEGALERTATSLARAAGGTRPLIVPGGASALWTWVGTAEELDPAALHAAMRDADEHVRAASGPARDGIAGFRRSHLAALSVQRLVAGNPAADPLTTFEEVEVVALAGHDEEQAAEFMSSLLGPLGADDATAARLRETVRVYLDEGGNAPRAAARLHTHRNTVLHRVARAEELLGHPVGERRLALALALELERRLGPRLRRPLLGS
jgi:DNA-binding PucR family transcriptional regulator